VKHYSANLLNRAAKAAQLATDGDLLGRLRVRLDEPGGKLALARELAITPFHLSGILRGRWPISDEIAEKLGYRKVVRYERLS
jgi:plasmid maintenance system antidote protein VapI